MKLLAALATAGVLALTASPAVAAPAHAHLSFGTARLARDRIAVKLHRSNPGWEFVARYPDGPDCERRSATHVNCGITAHRVDSEGIDEWVVYTVHVYEVGHGGYNAYTTDSGISEQP